MSMPLNAPGRGPTQADERIHPPYKIATLVAAAQDDGLSPAVLLAGTGLGAASLEDAEVKTSSRQFVAACANALAAGAPPDLPFRMGALMRVSSYGLYGFALLTCRTAREGMQFAQRFHRLAAPTFRLRLSEAGGRATWTYDDLLGLDPGSRLHRFLMAFQLALQVSLARDIWPHGLTPERVMLRHAQPDHHALYAQHLGCPALFDQPQDSAHFDARALDEPLPLHNPLTATMMRRSCERLCERLLEQASATGPLARRVYALLAERPGPFASMDEIAGLLKTTSRTLRRRLLDEGTSFQQVLNEVRANLAKEYLRNTRMNGDDIALALGFSDAANFRQAFRKWTAHSPSEFRRAATA
jgi:AraC-like DNA-binding protein